MHAQLKLQVAASTRIAVGLGSKVLLSGKIEGCI
jgi:hypothetical protein